MTFARDKNIAPLYLLLRIQVMCNAGVGMKVLEYYKHFVNPSNIMTVFNFTAEHTFVSSRIQFTSVNYSSIEFCTNFERKRKKNV